MAITEAIERFRGLIVQIATPYSTGTGFYISQSNLIVTNEHVARDNRSVVIKGEKFQKQKSEVLYLDTRLDLAFLAAPVMTQELKTPDWVSGSLKEGDGVLAIGHPYGLKYATTNGIISNMNHDMKGVRYIQHDAALNPGNSGGPLVTHQGEIAGINTFIVRDGNNLGFSLPAETLAETLEEFIAGDGTHAMRCHSCSNVLFADQIDDKYCSHCGAKAILPNEVEEYDPIGVSKTIESTLATLGHNVELARIGPNHWQIAEGSAKITLSYHDESGLIVGDAFLAELPKSEIKPIYQFLLAENYHLENLSLSVRGNEIILSLIIFDRYLNVDTAAFLMKHLFEKADHYDTILVEKYGALWKKET